MYPFERFSEEAKKVLTLAQDEAEKSHHSYIGTEHLLLGLIRQDEGLAAKVLAGLGVEIEEVRSTIESVLGRNERIRAQQIIPTSRVKKVIEIAFQEAQRMRNGNVETEHLLLGLLIEGEGIAAQVLEDLGATLQKVRGELERVAGYPPAPMALEEDEKIPASIVRLHSRLHSQLGKPVAPESGWYGLEPSEVVDQLRKIGQGRIGAAARTALALAEEEAIRGKAATVETEHLLIGLLRQAEGAAALAMKAVGLDIDDLRRVMESLSPAASGPSWLGGGELGRG